MIPVVDFENFKTLYTEKNPINGTKNAWEYYFKQLSGYTLEEVYSSKNVFICNGERPSGFIQGLTSSNSTYKELFKKHIVLQKHIVEKIEKYSYIFKDRVLGIHFRGKEFNYAPLHSFAPTIEQMFKYTDEILNKHNIAKIFMVTEEKNYLDAFVKKYGDMVLYTDAFRVAKINAYNLKPRENHRYLLGLEILCESILLSKCNGLLCSASNVSRNAMELADYEFSYCINNGTNVNNRYVARYLYGIKKLLPKKFGGLLDEVQITLKSVPLFKGTKHNTHNAL